MPNPTAAEYAAWRVWQDHGSPSWMVSRGDTLYVAAWDQTKAVFVSACLEAHDRLIAERDRKAEQIRRLREALDVALAETNKRHGFVKRDGKYGDWRDQIAAALAEGGGK